MSQYQFALRQGGKIVYLFPTLDADSSLPCAQFINSPLRKTQGKYSQEVNPQCQQAMHRGKKPPGGFRGHKTIYPGF